MDELALLGFGRSNQHSFFIGKQKISFVRIPAELNVDSEAS
jgi:hypothetical protein